MAVLLPEGKQSYETLAGIPLVGGKLFTFDAGTSNPRPTFSDAAGAVPNTNPVVLDARGEATIFWSGAYKVRLEDALGNVIWTQDNVSSLSGSNVVLDNYSADSGVANAYVAATAAAVGGYVVGLRLALKIANTNTGASTLNYTALGAKAIKMQNGGALGGGELQAGGIYELEYDGVNFQLLNPAVAYWRSPGEVVAGKTPVNSTYPVGWINRFAQNTVPGTTDMGTALQSALDSADLGYPVVLITDQNAISAPALIKPTSVENLSIVGQARTISIIAPTAIDIKQAPQNVNCLIFNQADNGHLHLRQIRFFSIIAFTGQIMVAIEGGGADGSGQAAFSMVVDDVWHSLSSTNTGYYRGAFSNLKALNCVYENVKDAAWILEGAGNGDLTFTNHQQFICFDNFIRASDANIKALVSVVTLHAYSHFRGRLIEFNKGIGLQFEDIFLEPDAANLGDVGLFKFTDSTNIIAVGFSMAARAGVPAGAVGIEINGTTGGEFLAGVINAVIGLLINAGAVISLDLDGVDFSNSATSCARLFAASGTLRTRNCKFNNGQLSNFVHAAANSIAWYSENDEFINAGLGGNAASRCLDLASSGTIVLKTPRIGAEVGGAAAAFFIAANGTGTVTLIDPTFVGTPASGIWTGSQALTVTGITGDTVVPYSAAMAINPVSGNVFIITPTNAVAFTINDPPAANSFRGMRITLRVRNTTGGALGALTFGATYKASAWTQPATGFSRSIDFEYNGAAWIEASRNTADIPN